MGYAVLIGYLQRIESASSVYLKGPLLSESHGAFKDALVEGFSKWRRKCLTTQLSVEFVRKSYACANLLFMRSTLG